MSANKNHAKIGRFCRPSNIEHVPFSTISHLFGYRSTDFVYLTTVIVYRGEMNIYFSYLFCLLIYNVYFRSLDAEEIAQISFCEQCNQTNK